MPRFRITPLRLALAIVVGSVAFAGVAYAANLGLTSNKLFAWSQTLTKGSCNQTSSTADDTYVQQANPSSIAGGTATTLSIRGSGSGSLDIALIRFNLSGCNLPTTAGADASSLKIYVETASSDTISVYPIYSSWSSSTLNWNGALGLSYGSTATTSFVPSATGTTTVQVTADTDAAIKAGVLWGWGLVDLSGAATTVIDSAESGQSARRPSLTLSYEK